MVRALQWFGCGVRGTKTVACSGEGTTMVRLRWSGYYDGWAALVMVLRWLGSGSRVTMTGAIGYYDDWTAVARVLR